MKFLSISRMLQENWRKCGCSNIYIWRCGALHGLGRAIGVQERSPFLNETFIGAFYKKTATVLFHEKCSHGRCLVPGVSRWVYDRLTWRTVDWLSRLSRLNRCQSTDWLEYMWSTANERGCIVDLSRLLTKIMCVHFCHCIIIQDACIYYLLCCNCWL